VEDAPPGGIVVEDAPPPDALPGGIVVEDAPPGGIVVEDELSEDELSEDELPEDELSEGVVKADVGRPPPQSFLIFSNTGALIAMAMVGCVPIIGTLILYVTIKILPLGTEAGIETIKYTAKVPAPVPVERPTEIALGGVVDPPPGPIALGGVVDPPPGPIALDGDGGRPLRPAAPYYTTRSEAVRGLHGIGADAHPDPRAIVRTMRRRGNAVTL
jgi:hypothetical protein